MAKIPSHKVKAGDDFELNLTVTNKSSPEAIAAETAVIQAQADYDEAIEADPQVPGDITAAETALADAKEAYALAIIVDITEWDIASSMDWCGRDISVFTVTKTEATVGKFQLTAVPAVTTLWKPRTYDADVQFTIDGKKRSSSTFNLIVERDVTNE